MKANRLSEIVTVFTTNDLPLCFWRQGAQVYSNWNLTEDFQLLPQLKDPWLRTKPQTSDCNSVGGVSASRLFPALKGAQCERAHSWLVRPQSENTHRRGPRGYLDTKEENGSSLWAQRGFSLWEEMIVIKVQGQSSFHHTWLRVFVCTDGSQLKRYLHKNEIRTEGKSMKPTLFPDILSKTSLHYIVFLDFIIY